MLRILHGLPFCISQPVEHPLRWFPSNPSVGSKIPHRVTRQFEFVQDLSGECLFALASLASSSLLARDIDPEFQLFRYSEFHIVICPCP
jgi:hypothetical protein